MMSQSENRYVNGHRMVLLLQILPETKTFPPIYIEIRLVVQDQKQKLFRGGNT